jgi:hypothetical protein
MTGRRRSWTRWRSLTDSSTSVSSSSGKGGGLATFRMRSSRTTTSTSPVASFGFTASGSRGSTRPTTQSTHSFRIACARSCASGAVSGLKTIWPRPSRSRRSMKITPPWSRRRCTQPQSTTSLPTCSRRSSPQASVGRSFPCGSRRVTGVSVGWRRLAGARRPRGSTGHCLRSGRRKLPVFARIGQRSRVGGSSLGLRLRSGCSDGASEARRRRAVRQVGLYPPLGR